MKKQIQPILATLSVSFFMFSFLLFSVDTTYAQTRLVNPLEARGINDMTSLLRVVLSAFMAIMFPITVLFIVYTGFLFLTAQGNPGEIAKAKEYLIYTIIGALIILGSYALSVAIQATVQNIAPGAF